MRQRLKNLTTQQGFVKTAKLENCVYFSLRFLSCRFLSGSAACEFETVWIPVVCMSSWRSRYGDCYPAGCYPRAHLVHASVYFETWIIRASKDSFESKNIFKFQKKYDAVPNRPSRNTRPNSSDKTNHSTWLGFGFRVVWTLKNNCNLFLTESSPSGHTCLISPDHRLTSGAEGRFRHLSNPQIQNLKKHGEGSNETQGLILWIHEN